MGKISQKDKVKKAAAALAKRKIQKEIKVDKEKVKAAFNNDIVSLEIMKTKKQLKTEEEAEEYYAERVKHRIYIVDDLEENYIIRLSYTDKKSELKSVDPEHIEEGDQYELSETIQEILRENMFPVIESNFPSKENQKQEGDTDESEPA